MRKLGIRIKSQAGWGAIPIAARGWAEVFDIETGQAITGVRAITVAGDVDGVITATVEFYPVVIQETT